MSYPDFEVDFTAERVAALPDIHPQDLAQAVDVYQQSFLRPPYSEFFTAEEAVAALQYILDKDGDLILGRIDDSVVGIAGGYYKDDRHYYIEELAVHPGYQGQGIGRKVLRHLLEVAGESCPNDFGIRTNADNIKAIGLYTSEGFSVGPVTTVVASRRESGRISLDERVHLRKKLRHDMEDEPNLNRVVVAYPSGNTTAVVFDQRLDTDREEFNKRMVASWQKYHPEEAEIEQCCFIMPATDPEAIGRVEMFGGEFCGNATRTGAWLLSGGQDYEGTIEASGVEGALAFTVKDGTVSVEMPLSREDDKTKLVDEGTIVQLYGIAHLVITDRSKVGATSAKDLCEEFIVSNKYGLAQQAAFGISYYDKQSGKSEFGVYVKEVNTVYDETACGSGTSCIGVALAAEAKDDLTVDVIQPTGEVIQTSATYDPVKKQVMQSRIAGTVSILYDGEYKLA
ncbi:MAG: hypothetical protein JWM81_847 [Candidatus Saccharibacteria bacterium]|nr:hypothetical protein [Candidatus Saccharibacteria bacterium]